MEPRSAVRIQRRCKTFVRRLDQNDQVFYTLARKAPPPDAEPTTLKNDFFEMPDLLLDLDAEGSRYVRPSDENDEERMAAKWNVMMPQRVAVRAQLKEFEEQLYESRRNVKNVESHPTNAWRLTSHDLLSVALRGASGGIEDDRGAGKDSDLSQRSEELNARRLPNIFETLRLENGIPSHAAEDDRLLLEWMMFRRKGLWHARRSGREQPPSPNQLSKALREHTSITGVRRLVFQALASGVGNSAYAEQLGFGEASTISPNIPREIRDACLKILGQKAENTTPRFEALTFLANLAERLPQQNSGIGAALSGLAFRLSAEAGLIEATSEWLHRDHADDIWDTGVESDDVLETLKAFVAALGNPQKGGVHSVHERQVLFQLLTGIDEHHSITPASFRALTMRYLRGDSKVRPQQAFSIYEAYIMLLGRLGAVRTLWKEWRVSAPAAAKLLKERNVRVNVETLLHASSMSSLRVAALPDGDAPDLDLGLAECVAADYHSIAQQSSGTWLSGGEAATLSSPSREAAVGAVVPALSLPLDKWLGKVKELPQRKAASA